MLYCIVMRRNFTLIELLVVVAIIAILASMLMPALTKAINSANTLKCTQTMKTYCLTMSIYANDWDNDFPTAYAESNYNTGVPEDSTAAGGYLANFIAPMQTYFAITGGGYDTNGVYYDPAPQEYATAIADRIVMPKDTICSAAWGWYEENKSDTGGSVNYYMYRLTSAGSYLHAGTYYDAHGNAVNMMGKRKLNYISAPSRYFYLHDTGFNSDTQHGVMRLLHSTGWNAAFLDGSVRFFVVQNSNGDPSYTRFLADDM